MKMFLIKACRALAAVCILSFVCSSPAMATELVEDVEVRMLPDGYEVKINFLLQLRYTGNTNGDENDNIRIQLRPLNFQALTEEEQELLRERIDLVWDSDLDISLRELTFEGGDPERPLVNFIFSKSVKIDVRSGVDLRSLIVTVKTKRALQQDGALEIEGEVVPIFLEAPKEIVPDNKKLVATLKDARKAMTKGDYDRAVQLYTKILNKSDGDTKKQAQEFLGLAREKKKQFAHAKAEYEKFLRNYPDGPDADRVRQRLAGLVTATKKPKARLREGSPAEKSAQRIVEKQKWDKRFYGNVSQFYFYDQTTQEGGETQINRSDLNSDVDLNGRWRSDEYDIRTKFSGGYRRQLKQDEDDDSRVSSLSFETEHKPSGLFGKIGRQTRTSGGVLGRFDGVHTSYKLKDKLKLNAVLGLPVESTRDIEINPDKQFYGLSVDLGTYKEKWDFNAFTIVQNNEGITDRQAVGGEVRYFDKVKSFFTLVDYDVFFNALNIFLFNGHWNVKEDTTINIVLDRRRSPLLTVNNAIQGQGVSNISELLGRFTNSELKELARDRAAISMSGTLGVTHSFSDDIQITAEVTVSELTSTIASGGVEASPGTGGEYFYSTQLITNNNFVENDSIIYGVRYSDTQNNETYSFTLNGRFPYNKDLRFSPKLRVDYRTEPDSNDKRLKVRPTLRADYRFKKWIRFETEIGGEWVDETSSGIDRSSTELFATVGYRINF